MEFSNVQSVDADRILELVTDVSETDVLPLFDAKGKQAFFGQVIPGLKIAILGTNSTAIKAEQNGEIVGFAALRNGNYLTHLFVAKHAQGQGTGRLLVDNLLETTNAAQISVRASINAMHFYIRYGFVATGTEGEVNGIRFVPMMLSR